MSSAFRTLPRRLRRHRSGAATVEMALSFPFLLVAGLWGVELANYGVMTMRMSQLAAQIADNASRVGEKSSLQGRKVYEADVNDLLQGANIQGGQRLDLFDHGRVIISSLEVNEDDDQYIHWQRCMGKKNWASTYGDEGDEPANGMGPPGEEVFAFEDEAVMFVELAYDYQPLISARFVGTPTITAIASFTVRDDRDLTQIYQRDPGSPDPIADCTKFDNPYPPFIPVSAGGSSGGSTSSSAGGASGSSSGGSNGGGSNGGSNGGGSSSSSSGGGSTSSTSASSSTSSTSSSSSWGGGGSSWGGGGSSWGGGGSSWGGGSSGRGR